MWHWAHASWLFWDRPRWAIAELWAVAALMVLWGIASRTKARLVTGKDGRWSTSKAGYLIWTYALLFIGVATLIHEWSFHGIFDTWKPDYMILLGLPAATAFGAKVIRSNQAAAPDASGGKPSVTAGL